jgi:Zn-dependent protease
VSPSTTEERAIPDPSCQRQRSRAALACAFLAAAPLPTGTVFGNLDTIGVVLALLLLILSLTFHEVAHGWVALQCGDTTAKDLGRLTLNPLPHIDLFMTVMLPAFFFFTAGFFFGGAKPVPVTFHRLRHPWRDMMLVALAGPLSNLLLAFFFFFLWRILVGQGWFEGQRLLPVLEAAFAFNVLLAVFNLVPIPPLDGSRVMAWLLPPGLRSPYLSLERVGLLLVFLLFFLGPQLRQYGLPDLGGWVHRGMNWVAEGIAGIAAWFGIQ